MLKLKPAVNSAVSLYLLPNGEILRFRCYTRFFRDKGDQFKWDRHADSPELQRALDLAASVPVSEDVKKKLALLGLWNSDSDQDALAADFDKLPPGFADFAVLREELKHCFGKRAVVLESPRGKVKAIFVVWKPLGMRMNTETALASLKSILGPELFPFIDKTPTSLRQCFLTKDGSSLLSEELRRCIPFEACIEHEGLYLGDKNTEHCIHEDYSIHNSRPSYEQYPGTMDQWPTLKSFADTDTASENLIRTLICIDGLIEGFDLPQRYFATLIGSSQPTLSRRLDRLEAEGQLRCIESHRMFPVRRAKRFIAQGELLDAIGTAPHPRRSKVIPLDELVADIRKENFYTPAFDIGRMHFKNDPDSYVRFMEPYTNQNQSRRERVKNNAKQLRERMADATPHRSKDNDGYSDGEL